MVGALYHEEIYQKSYRVRNWKQYTAALVNRGNLAIWFEKTTVEVWINTQQTGNRGANDCYSDSAIECILTLEVIYLLRLRQTERFVWSLLELASIQVDIPDYTTLCRRRQPLDVSLAVRASVESLHMVVDSTGVKVYGERESKVHQPVFKTVDVVEAPCGGDGNQRDRGGSHDDK